MNYGKKLMKKLMNRCIMGKKTFFTAFVGDADFVSKLNEEEKKKAKEELHELNDKDREGAVQALRKWALEQKWLKTMTG